MDYSEEDEMNLYLKVIKTVALNVKRSETTRTLKALFHEKEGTPENLQELFFMGKQLKDDHKLVDYGIQMNSTLHLFLQTIDRITLLVNIPSNEKTFGLEAKNHETVENIKLLILAKEGILPEQYTLFHLGKLLEDNKTLTSLNIKSGSTLYVVFNPRDVMSVSVKMPSGEILKLEVKVLHTIHDVKAIIQSMVGFSVSMQKLTYAGNLVEDSKTLACYNIEENSLLEMLPLPFQIFVKDWGGKTTVLNVFKEDRVVDVKKKFLNKLGLPVTVHPFYLVFAGRLEDDRDLASYNIQKDSTLHASFRARVLSADQILP
ncbi:polyubiquitin 11-like [Rhododendron vialii]|uniref:polyubiquitin 11-like n=1 Tax=Rhododendron vialii TaxID=182163 RepID=UPI00265FE222|nr:polyubiquitin 11-like [Rhododendron vialii]